MITVVKTTLMCLCLQKRFVSAVDIIGSNNVEEDDSLFTYFIKKSGPRIEPCGTPHEISCT